MIANAKVSFLAVDKKQYFYSFNEACIDSLGPKDYLLIEKDSINKLDCMGTILDTSLFCKSKIKNNYIRSYLNTKVVCESATQVHLKIDCLKKHKYLCQNPKAECLKLQKNYANSLVLNYFSGNDQKLTCLYQRTSKIKPF